LGLPGDSWIFRSFADLPPEDTAWERARVVVLPVPFEHTVSFRPGTRFGPAAILQASQQLELYDEELGSEPYKVGLHTLEELAPLMDGERMCRRVAEAVAWLVAEGKFPLVLGGEHSISYGVVKALAESYSGLGVLQLDAHADLRESYQGTKYSHACVMRRVREICPAVQVGIRSLSREEAKTAEDKGWPLLFARDIVGKDDWQEEVLSRLPQRVYITIDLDVFDPGIMPAVGTPEPGGLGWYEVLGLLRRVTADFQVVGVDLVELAPIPYQPAPDFLAARLAYKILGYLQAAGQL